MSWAVDDWDSMEYGVASKDVIERHTGGGPVPVVDLDRVPICIVSRRYGLADTGGSIAQADIAKPLTRVQELLEAPVLPRLNKLWRSTISHHGSVSAYSARWWNPWVVAPQLRAEMTSDELQEVNPLGDADPPPAFASLSDVGHAPLQSHVARRSVLQAPDKLRDIETCSCGIAAHRQHRVGHIARTPSRLHRLPRLNRCSASP